VVFRKQTQRVFMLAQQQQRLLHVREQLHSYVSTLALCLALTTETNTTIPTTPHQNTAPTTVSIALSILLQLIIIFSITLGQQSGSAGTRCAIAQTRQPAAGEWKSIRQRIPFDTGVNTI